MQKFKVTLSRSIRQTKDLIVEAEDINVINDQMREIYMHENGLNWQDEDYGVEENHQFHYVVETDTEDCTQMVIKTVDNEFEIVCDE